MALSLLPLASQLQRSEIFPKTNCKNINCQPNRMHSYSYIELNLTFFAMVPYGSVTIIFACAVTCTSSCLRNDLYRVEARPPRFFMRACNAIICHAGLEVPCLPAGPVSPPSTTCQFPTWIQLELRVHPSTWHTNDIWRCASVLCLHGLHCPQQRPLQADFFQRLRISHHSLLV